jgi:RND family efflux transporter MFP subunit
MEENKTVKRRSLTAGGKGKLVAGICLLACLAFGLHWVLAKPASSQSQRPSDMKPAVKAAVLAKADLSKNIQLTGKTVPEAQVDIAAKYSGKISQVLVALGQSVTPGQVLLVQDTSDVEAALAQNSAALRGAGADALQSNAAFQASYHKAKADYDRAQTNVGRYRSLFEMGAVSKEALDKVEEQLTAAKADLDIWSNQMVGGSAAAVVSKQAAFERATASVEALRQERSDMIIRAPRAGVIGYRQAEVGGMAQAGQKLLAIVDNSKIYVDSSVSEKDIGQIALGTPAQVSVDSLGKTYSGKVIYISPSMDSATQAFTVRLALEAADESLKAGMFARTDITVVLRKDTLIVPKEAVVSLNGIDRVFVIDAQSQVQERVVKLGFRNDNSIEVIEGLSAGEKVAITNIARLKNGSVITEDGR